MNRNIRTRLAEQTLELLKRGHYKNQQGATVDLNQRMEAALAATSFHEAPLPPFSIARRNAPMAIEVTAETTVAAIARLHREGAGHLAALNFASARNPGGGFLGGAQAQEESLARSSGLYPCLLRQPLFYERHRNSRCLLYQDLAIFSPNVPFFVDDDGELLDEPAIASVITSPAPNAGALANNEPARLPLVPEALRRRAGFVLQLGATRKVDTLILGAWGCGVFRNDPVVVADAFATLLLGDGPFASSFAKVVFAIYDRSPGQDVRRAFESRLQ